MNRNRFRPFRTYGVGDTVTTTRRLPETAGYVNQVERITFTIGKVEANGQDTFRVWRAGDENRPLAYMIVSGRERFQRL